MRFSVVRLLLLAMLATGAAIGGAYAQTQTPPAVSPQPDAATGAPLRLLVAPPAPLTPAPVTPAPVTTAPPVVVAPAKPVVARPIAVPPVPKPAAPAITSAPVEKPVIAVSPLPSVVNAPPVVNLPPAQPPEPVSADLFAPKQSVPVVDTKPVVAVAPAPGVAPAAGPKPVPEKAADAKAEERKLTVIVAGDSIADGIWGGLYRKLLRDKRYEIVRKAKNSSGFVAFDWVEELGATEELKRADAVIFLAGTNDRQSLVRQGKPRFLFRTRAWEEGYVERVSALMQSLKAQNIPLVWISLPIARKDEFNKDSRYLNDIFAAAARQAGIHYIDIWPMFADKDGQYTAYLPDADGRNRLLRDNDGIHFTPRGYEMIADVVLEKLQKTVPAFQQAAMAEPIKSGKAN